MRLKKLELHGFKSFADKTEFTFEEGVTGFVGPNGSGKSNVVDAMKWILGEQSAKSLRGNEMADVIFNGNGSRRPMPFAEASLTIINDRGLLPIDFEEVRVTRRLFRTGESEYLLNNQPCRLRDLKELFMDTGIGATSYSFIEQGKVDRLLQANAKERRAVFEEAAGISKYKAKKREAQNKLARVDQNLLRLNDIIEEVQRRLRSIRIQAGRARKYKEYSNKLKELRIAFSLRTYRELGRQAKEAAKGLGELKDRTAEVSAQISALEAQIAAYDEQRIALDQRITETHERRTRIDVAMTDADAKIEANRNLIKEMDIQEIRLAQQAETLAERLQEIREELAQRRADLDALHADLEASREAVQQKQAEARSLAEEETAVAEGIERAKADVMELMRQSSLVQNELVSSRTSRLALEAQRKRLENRRREIEGEVSQLEQERQELIAEQQLADAELRELAQQIQQTQDALRRTTERAERIADEITEWMQVRSRKQSRQELLREMEVKAEGIDASVKHVLAEAKAGRLSGVRGSLVDCIAVDFEHAHAVDAALGGLAQAVLTETTAAAVDAMRRLTEDGKGRCAFLPMDRVRPRRVAKPDVLQEADVVGRAADLVRVDAERRPLVEHLLGDTVVVRDVSAAARLATNGASDCRLVTLDGHVFEPRGAVTGGSKQAAAGVVTRRAELESVEQELRGIEERLAELEQERRETNAEAARLREAIDAAQRAASDAQLKKQAKQAAAEQREREVNALREEESVARSEIADIQESLQEADAKESELSEKQEALQQRRAALEQKVIEDGERLRSLQNRRHEMEALLTDARIALGQKEEKARNFVERIAAIERELQDRSQEREQAIENSGEAARKREEAKLEIERNQARLVELGEQKQEVDERLRELNAQREDLLRRLSESNEHVNTLRAQLREVEDAAHQKELAHAEVVSKMNAIAERVREDYEIDLAERVRLQPDDPDWDWEDVEQEIAKLRDQLARMGNVNLEAIDEMDELEIRERFLVAQRDDLLKSQRQLQDIIRKINRTSRELFEKTFKTIRQNFQETFRKLFGGGNADLVLEEGEDPLEAGIEIIARPPGKEPRSITLLSGGEKTMTTVALLFAIFQAKPSPFCVLDEVDAALDESNIDRFVMMVKEFVKKSQFVIVTHSKRTMTVADAIYGITMQESGISKKVSVRFEDATAGRNVA